MASQVVAHQNAAVQPRRLIPDRVFRQWLGGISKATQWRLEKSDPSFPKKVKIRRQNFRDEEAARAYVERLIERSGG